MTTTERLAALFEQRFLAAVIEALGRVADRFTEDVLAAGDPIDAADTRRIQQLWDEEVDELAEQVAGFYATATAALLQEVLGPDVAVPELLIEQLRTAYLLQARNRLADVGDVLWDETRRTLADGQIAGEGYDQLRTRLREAFARDGKFLSESRAMRIARTEVQSAVNRGALDGVRAASGDVRPPYKTWVATMDGRTRDAHFAADGQTVPIDGQFIVGGQLLDYPGDPAASAANVINCRCTWVSAWSPEGPLSDGDSGRQALSDAQIEKVVAEFASRGVIRESVLVAAADPGEHTGAMIALAPSEADIERLTIDGGEPPEELHMTLLYLGEAADIPEDSLDTLRSELEMVSGQRGPLTAQAFAAAMFNPNGESPCWVLQVGGDGVAEMHLAAIAVGGAASDETWTYPEQRQPWCAHVTLAYTDDIETVSDAVDRVGEVTFDRLRLAVAGTVYDYPLQGETDMKASNTETPPEFIFSSARVRGATLVDIPAFIEARISVDGPADENGMQPWSGVLTVENIPTGDGRLFTPGALRWEDPGDGWPLRWDIEDDGMHMGAVTVGKITEIERDGDLIVGRGVFDTNIPNGAAAAGLVERGTVTGVSIDMDDIPENSVDVSYELGASADADDDWALAADDTPWVGSEDAQANLLAWVADEDPEFQAEFLRATHFWTIDDGDPADPATYRLPFVDIVDETPVAIPAGVDWAVAEAERMLDAGELTEEQFSEVMDDASDYLERIVAEADKVEELLIIDDELEATAWDQFSSLPKLPATAFADPTELLADNGEFIHYENGRIFGWVAQNGVCHDAFSGSCVTPPKKGTDLETFNRQPITLDDGSTIKVGVFTMDAGHDNDGAEAGSFRAQFDNTRTVAGLVRVGINDRGTWFSGVAAPWLSEWDRQVLTACRPSGHWKRLRNGRWSLRAVLSVPVPGFPNRVAASAAVVDRSNLALVASAAIAEPETEVKTAGTVALRIVPEIDIDDENDVLAKLAAAVVDEIEHRQAVRAEVEALAASLNPVRAEMAETMRASLGVDVVAE